MRPKFWFVGASVAGLAVLSAAANAEVIKVKVEQLEFMPSEVSAHVGDTIEWTNTGFLDHTATEKEGKWEVIFKPGETGRVELKQPGTVHYYCRLHPNMVGKITVTAK